MIKLCIPLILWATAQLVYGQDLYDQLSEKVCHCIEKEKLQSLSEIQPCFEKVMLENVSEIMAYHQVKSVTEINGEEVGQKVTKRLVINCPYINSLLNEAAMHDAPQYAADTDLNCEGLQAGEYYYLNFNRNGESSDTVFVTFREDEYLERMKNGRYYTKLRLDWESPCHFVLRFIESNNPETNLFYEVGEKFSYEVIKNNDSGMVVKYVLGTVTFYTEYVKLK